MHSHEQHGLLIGKSYQHATDQRAVLQREGCLCLLG